MNIIFILLVFQFLIFIHELGHFLAAKRCNVEVDEFSLGMPPRILSKKIKNTLYSLSLLPIGGYVKIKGFMLDEDSTQKNNYASKSIWERFTIIFAGPLFNIIFSFLLFSLVFWIGLQRNAVYYAPPIVGQVAADIQPNGLQKNDIILKVNQTSVHYWRELAAIVVQTPQAAPIQLEVQRENKIFNLEIPRTSFSSLSPRIEPIIGQVLEKTPAEKIGLQKGDRIVSINNQKVEDWLDISALLQENASNQGFLLLERAGRKNELQFFSQLQVDSKRWVLGISPPSVKVHYSFFPALGQSFLTIYENITTTFNFLGKLIVGRTSSDAIGGPIMIVSVINQSIKRGFVDLLYITAIISLQLAIFNLLPIPALDGGHLILLLAEKIKGRPLSISFRKKFQSLGFFFLISLLIFITIKDIGRFF